MEKGVTVWFTGLSGAGKTTLAKGVETILCHYGMLVERLDGDIFRQTLGRDLGFSRADREKNIERAALMAKLLTRNGVIVLCAFISPYKTMRDFCRREIGDFLEVYVRASMDTLLERDTKGLYRKALAGEVEVEEFTGVTAPYEEPDSPELICDTDKESVPESVARVIALLKAHGYFPKSVPGRFQTGMFLNHPKQQILAQDQGLLRKSLGRNLLLEGTLRRLAQFCSDLLVNLSPRLFLESLQRRHLNILLRGVSRPSMFQWEDIVLPVNLNGFEDLAFLFWSNPINRGILRMDFDEAATMFKIIKTLPHPTGVEIGRLRGGSTILLAVAIGEKGKLLSIDIAPKADDMLRSILHSTGLLVRVELLVGSSINIDRNGTYDFVFIDGDHSYEGARLDYVKWGNKVKVGGYLIFHDMANARPHSTQFRTLTRLREELISGESGKIELVVESGSLSIFRRIVN